MGPDFVYWRNWKNRKPGEEIEELYDAEALAAFIEDTIKAGKGSGPRGMRAKEWTEGYEGEKNDLVNLCREYSIPLPKFLA